MPQQRSLASVIALRTAGSVAAAMGVYAAYEYVRSPADDPAALAVTHVGHALVLGGIVYLVLRLALGRMLVRPLHEISSHLYRIGVGRLEPVVIATDIQEIHQLASGVNLMVQRMRQGFEAEEVGEAARQLAELRETARRVETRPPKESKHILAKTGHFEGPLAAMPLEASPDVPALPPAAKSARRKRTRERAPDSRPSQVGLPARQ